MAVKRIAHPQRQLTGVDRLAEDVGGSKPQGEQFGGGIRRPGKNDGRNVLQGLVGAYPVKNVEPADFRHVDIQKHQIGLIFRQKLQSARRVAGFDEAAIARILENASENVDDDGLIVDDHDGGIPGRLEAWIRVRPMAVGGRSGNVRFAHWSPPWGEAETVWRPGAHLPPWGPAQSRIARRFASNIRR